VLSHLQVTALEGVGLRANASEKPITRAWSNSIPGRTLDTSNLISLLHHASEWCCNFSADGRPFEYAPDAVCRAVLQSERSRRGPRGQGTGTSLRPSNLHANECSTLPTPCGRQHLNYALDSGYRPQRRVSSQSHGPLMGSASGRWSVESTPKSETFGTHVGGPRLPRRFALLGRRPKLSAMPCFRRSCDATLEISTACSKLRDEELTYAYLHKESVHSPSMTLKYEVYSRSNA